MWSLVHSVSTSTAVSPSSCIAWWARDAVMYESAALSGSTVLLSVSGDGAAWRVPAGVCWRCEKREYALPSAQTNCTLNMGNLITQYCSRGAGHMGSSRRQKKKQRSATNSKVRVRIWHPAKPHPQAVRTRARRRWLVVQSAAAWRCSGGDWTTPARKLDSNPVCIAFALTPLP
jgi:hypothetical protein